MTFNFSAMECSMLMSSDNTFAAGRAAGRAVSRAIFMGWAQDASLATAERYGDLPIGRPGSAWRSGYRQAISAQGYAHLL